MVECKTLNERVATLQSETVELSEIIEDIRGKGYMQAESAAEQANVDDEQADENGEIQKVFTLKMEVELEHQLMIFCNYAHCCQ